MGLGRGQKGGVGVGSRCERVHSGSVGVCTRCGECVVRAGGVQSDVGEVGRYRGVGDGRAGAGVWLFCRYSPCSFNSISFPTASVQSPEPELLDRVNCECGFTGPINMFATCDVVVMDVCHVTCWVCDWYGREASIVVVSALFPLVVFYLLYCVRTCLLFPLFFFYGRFGVVGTCHVVYKRAGVWLETAGRGRGLAPNTQTEREGSGRGWKWLNRACAGGLGSWGPAAVVYERVLGGAAFDANQLVGSRRRGLGVWHLKLKPSTRAQNGVVGG